MVKKVLFTVIVLIAAPLAAIATELAVARLLDMATWDVTGQFFTTGVLPVMLVIQVIVVSLLVPVFRSQLILNLGLYVLVAAGFYAFMLAQFFNPPSDILRYEVVLALAIAVAVGLNWNRLRRV